MTYQELIRCYPWIDLAWEVFKGVSPTAIALVTIFVTELFVRKRNKVNKRREMKLQSLEKILAWIHETRRNVFEISSSLSKVLLMRDIPDRVPKFNEVLGQMTEMNKSIFILSDTYKEISYCMGYDLKLDQFKDAIHCYSETINQIGCKFLSDINTQQAISEINSITAQTRENIKESSLLLVTKMSQLYGKRRYSLLNFIGHKGEKRMLKKKKLYTPYNFDIKYEICTFKHVGLDYGNYVIANKGWIRNFRRWFRKHIYNRNESKYKICNTYEDWEIYVKSKLPIRTDYKNYMHWLIEQRRFAESQLETVKAILIPIYIAFLSIKEVFFKEKTVDLGTVLILCVAIAITSAYVLVKEKENLDFWNDWIDIINNVM